MRKKNRNRIVGLLGSIVYFVAGFDDLLVRKTDIPSIVFGAVILVCMVVIFGIAFTEKECACCI